MENNYPSPQANTGNILHFLYHTLERPHFPAPLPKDTSSENFKSFAISLEHKATIGVKVDLLSLHENFQGQGGTLMAWNH